MNLKSLSGWYLENDSFCNGRTKELKKSIRVLVVDDSAWMRKIISETINDIPGLTCVGKARNGQVALDMIEKVKPDVMTLDMEMPVLNGLETLKHLNEMAHRPLKVIMISSVDDQRTTVDALELGAVDFIKKPLNLARTYEQFKSKLKNHITILFEDKMKPKKMERKIEPTIPIMVAKVNEPQALKAIVIGASTGGPKALVTVIQSLPKELDVPVLIVQHMPEGFTASFSERLNQLAEVPVFEAIDGMPIQAGVVYVAPGGWHMLVKDGKIRLNKQNKLHGVRPAVDYLFDSAATQYGNGLVGVILTGMGRDGTAGCRSILKHGGYTIAQNQETSVVFGMPASAIKEGTINKVAGLEDISLLLNKMVVNKSWN